MELPLLVLVLVSTCGGQDWTTPTFCRGQCPQFTVVETHQDFEERLYVPAEWITTKMGGSGVADLLAARSRLAKAATDADSWPVLITVTNGSDLSLSWFVPPGTMESKITDPSVTLQSRPEVTVYVRIYGGNPSIKSGEENAKILYDDLKKAEKTGADADTYTWAGYDNYISFTHHNEIWIEKSQ
ncbi:hypothetical protein VZT92_002071 [Zoarces viviparus]|uniref:Heme-binding protein 2 n=1 Tax=Zoarces viviparus TaxID=48416 RepID=A0AAW1G5E6_ZOAVI